MYRVELTDEQRQELTRRLRTPGLAPRTRERLEMVRLSDAGWGVPRIAAHVSQHEQTVRRWVKAFLSGGFDALDALPHRGQKSGVTPEARAEVCRWLTAGERAYNSRQIAEEAAARLGVRRSPSQWRRLLGRERMYPPPPETKANLPDEPLSTTGYTKVEGGATATTREGTTVFVLKTEIPVDPVTGIIDREALAKAWMELEAHLGLEDGPKMTAQELQQSILANGVRPEDNLGSRDIIRQRYGCDDGE